MQISSCLSFKIHSCDGLYKHKTTCLRSTFRCCCIQFICFTEAANIRYPFYSLCFLVFNTEARVSLYDFSVFFFLFRFTCYKLLNCLLKLFYMDYIFSLAKSNMFRFVSCQKLLWKEGGESFWFSECNNVKHFAPYNILVSIQSIH